MTVGPGARSKGHIKDGQFVVHAKQLEDGSLIQQTTKATTAMQKLLAQEGETEETIAETLHRFAEAPDNTKVSLGARYEAVKWSIAGLQPTLDGPLLDPVVAVKSAYEFLALHVGTAIHEQTTPLKAIRQSLREGKLDARCIEVERLHAPEAMPFHGLLFEGNLPYAKVQARLFGQLAFRVHFKQLSVGGKRGMYTHDLETNEEHVHQLLENDG